MRIIAILISLLFMGEQSMALTLSSPVFKSQESIPSHYTCDDENISPPLEWSGIPNGTKSLVLIMDDPDVPKTLRPDGMYDHWVLFNISPDVLGLSENAKDVPGVNLEGVNQGKAIEGKNTSNKLGYTGPCPPDRQHRYFFKLFALDTILKLPAGATKAEVLAACQGHILDQAELMGVYNRPQNMKS